MSSGHLVRPPSMRIDHLQFKVANGQLAASCRTKSSRRECIFSTSESHSDLCGATTVGGLVGTVEPLEPISKLPSIQIRSSSTDIEGNVSKCRTNPEDLTETLQRSRFPFSPARPLGSRSPLPAGSNLKPDGFCHHIHEGEKIRSRLKGSDGDHVESVQVRNRVSLDAIASHAGTPLRTGRCIIKCLT